MGISFLMQLILEASVDFPRILGRHLPLFEFRFSWLYGKIVTERFSTIRWISLCHYQKRLSSKFIGGWKRTLLCSISTIFFGGSISWVAYRLLCNLFLLLFFWLVLQLMLCNWSLSVTSCVWRTILVFNIILLSFLKKNYKYFYFEGIPKKIYIFIIFN